MVTILVATHCAAVVLALGLVAFAAHRRGYRQRGRELEASTVDAERAAFERGRQVGGDELSQELVSGPDLIDVTWPRARRADRRPS